MTYVPKGRPAPVCKPAEFPFAAVALDHGHIYGQCHGLLEAGGDLRCVFDPDARKVEAFLKQFPQARVAASLEAVLDDPAIKLVAAAAVPSERGPLGCRVMEAGKDYFTDKAPFTSLGQLDEARQTVARTGRKYMVYYSERLHVECAVFAGELIQDGAIGKVLHVAGFGPHRLDAPSRPEWFFQKEKYGGILCDIGSHQFEQFLFYTGAADAEVLSATAGNRSHPQHPQLEDFGDAHLLADNGATNYTRVDWLTPAASRTWGDGRTFILGTNGYIELRKYVEVGRPDEEGGQLYLVNDNMEKRYSVKGQVGYPFFGALILDCLHRTENAMTQAHAFKAAELTLLAQAAADTRR